MTADAATFTFVRPIMASDLGIASCPGLSGSVAVTTYASGRRRVELLYDVVLALDTPPTPPQRRAMRKIADAMTSRSALLPGGGVDA